MSRIRIGVALFATSLLLAAVAAPWLAVHGMGVISWVVQGFFHAVCHQQPERSFLFQGQPWGVCARCAGIYAGLSAGLFLQEEVRCARGLLVTVLVLNAADVAAEMAGFHGNLPGVRFMLGLSLGAAVSLMLDRRNRFSYVR